jgi:lysyl-tRNA synthetase class 2
MSRQDILNQLRNQNQAYLNNFTPSISLPELATHSEPFDATEFAIAGRVQFLRSFGKSMFVRITSQTSSFQTFLALNHLGPVQYQLALMIQAGDIIGVRGILFRTKAGEVTLQGNFVAILTKSLQSPPEKFHGLTDPEARFRERYVDLLANEEVRRLFINRSLIVQTIRQYLVSNNYLEVETPILQNMATGANARPFTTHHNALDMELFLRIAPELYLKRLLVGGLERVFELNRNFRNEGLSTRHNPEFTMVEFYETYTNYEALMNRLESLIQGCAQAVNQSVQITFNGQVINLGTFTRMSMEESIRVYSRYRGSLSQIEDLRNYCRQYGEVNNFSHGELINYLFSQEVESQLIQPHFITHYPLEVSPLARRCDQLSVNNIVVTERFELFIGGMEIANGFNELNDPADQLARFQAQQALAAAGDEEAHPVDLDYIRALEFGLPPCAGAGLGVDRLCMLLLNQANIREVILFPHMRPRDP